MNPVRTEQGAKQFQVVETVFFTASQFEQVTSTAFVKLNEASNRMQIFRGQHPAQVTASCRWERELDLTNNRAPGCTVSPGARE